MVIEYLLKLLNSDEFLVLFEKVVRERNMRVWPVPADAEEKQVALKQLHGVILSAGFDRGLASALQESEQKVREQLGDLRRRTGGIIMSGE
jgi:hypothetical protein